MPDHLWDYCCGVYADDAVARCCLTLQDRYQANVNFLLICAWLAKKGCCASIATFKTLQQAVDEWHRQTVMPLRELRIGLKRWQSCYAELSGLREQVKAAELAAEHWEIARLQDAVDSLKLDSEENKSFTECFRANLCYYQEAAQLPAEFSQSVEFHTLLDAFAALE